MPDPEIERLLRPAESKRLAPAPPREPIPAAEGVAIPPDSDNAVDEGSIASPLTETGSSGVIVLTSSDGLFSAQYPAQTEYSDANGATVIIIHA